MTAFEPASKLFDLEIRDAQGEFVGWVSELLMDVSRGQIEYVLITLPAERPHRAARVTVPWSIVRAESRRNDRWQLSVNKAALEKLASIALHQ